MATKWLFQADLISVVDGDTVKLRTHKMMDYGFRFHVRGEYEDNFRLARIDAPEKRGDTKEAGLASKVWLEDRLQGASLEVESEKHGKYRWIIELYEVKTDGTRANINDELVAAGHAIYREY